MKRKPTYLQKIRLAIFFDIGQVIMLLIMGCGVMAIVAPMIMKGMAFQVAASAAGGIVALLIGLPLHCDRRLQAMEKELGSEVPDAVVEWFATSSKGDKLDLPALIEKVQSEKMPTAE